MLGCDGSEWYQLDDRDDTMYLKKYMDEASFAVVNPGEYGFIKTRQTGKNTDGNDHSFLCKIELFDTLIE